jgi:acyl-CoA dehydrogenase
MSMFDGSQPITPPSGIAYPLFREEHEQLRESIRRFVDKEISPFVEEWEEAGDFPQDLYLRCGEIGFFGLKFAEEFGGSGPDFLAAAVFNEELARCGAGGVAAGLGAHTDLASLYVGNYGTKQQLERWLVPSIKGEVIGALAVTEPDAGSDVASLRTRAVKDGDSYVIDGSKTFITNGSKADYVVVAARTGGEGHAGISLIVVEKQTPGFSTNRLQTVGWRTSHTAELFFDSVRVPAENLLGGVEGEGFKQIMGNFGWERLAMALASNAAAQKTLDAGIAYASERQAFGRPISKFQVWKHRFADLASEIAASRSLTYHALRRYVLGEPAIREIALAKSLACELDWRVADECLQVHGGWGYMMEYPVQRAWRDSRLGPIGGGTTEIMREIVAKLHGLG